MPLQAANCPAKSRVSGAANGKWKGGTSTNRGYPRIQAGPLRGQYVHRLVAEAMLHRPLGPKEDVHHKDEDKLNPHWTNLLVAGHGDHSWLTGMTLRVQQDGELRAKWEAFLQSLSEDQQRQLKELDHGITEQNQSIQGEENQTPVEDAECPF